MFHMRKLRSPPGFPGFMGDIRLPEEGSLLPVRAAVLFILFSFIPAFAAVSWAGVEGRLTTTLQSDNRLNTNETFVEEYGDLLFRGDGISSGVSLAGRVRDGDWEGSVYQLYLEKELRPSFTLKAGRFERADASGFYTVDGLSMKKQENSATLEVYGGRPMRIEDYRSTEADLVAGMDGVYLMEGLDLRAGGQFFKYGDASGRLTWGIRKSGTPDDSGYGSYRVSASGSYVVDRDILETALLSAEKTVAKGGIATVSWAVYQPDSRLISFRERFYGTYATGREEAVGVGFIHSTAFVNGQQISRENGIKGYRIKAGIEGKEGGVEGSYLYLDGEKGLNLFAGREIAVYHNMLIVLEGGYQYLEKATTGINHGIGAEAEVRRMVKGGLYLSAYGVYIANSRMDDEYRVGMRVTKYLNGGN